MTSFFPTTIFQIKQDGQGKKGVISLRPPQGDTFFRYQIPANIENQVAKKDVTLGVNSYKNY